MSDREIIPSGVANNLICIIRQIIDSKPWCAGDIIIQQKDAELMMECLDKVQDYVFQMDKFSIELITMVNEFMDEDDEDAANTN